MNIFVRAVISGVGFSVGQFLFNKVKERVAGKDSEPQRVVIINADDFRRQRDV